MRWFRLGSFLMAIAVLLGAFGAHALKARLDPAMMDIYKTGVMYHMVHALALLAVAWISTQQASKARLAGIFFTTGIFLFSGSLYLLAISGQKWFGAVTPLGGLCFVAGWTCLIFIS